MVRTRIGVKKITKKYQEVKLESSSSTGTDALHVLYFAFSFRIRTTHFSKGELEVRLLFRFFVKNSTDSSPEQGLIYTCAIYTFKI